MQWLRIFAAMALAAALQTTADAGDAPAATVRDARVEQLADGTSRVSVDLDRAVEPRVFILDGPDRLVIDLRGARPALMLQGTSGGVVTRIRQGARPDGARLVFDLSRQAKPSLVRTARGPEGVRLTLLLRPAMAAPAAKPAPARTEAAPDPVSPRGQAARAELAAASRQRVIVIDAGHGGHDPGAEGASGAREKSVVLAAALALRSALESRGGYKVVLTRDGDRFLPLQERVSIARDNKADLFISLHADSNPNGQAKGATVYTLSERGGQRAKGVMEAQDWDMDLGDAPHSAQVEKILVDLAQRETTNRSADFAQTLIRELSGDTPLLNRSHRNAGFFVLLAPDVPAVLLEMGFLTNPQDESRMTNSRSRRQMMNAVADAIDVYFAKARDYAGR